MATGKRKRATRTAAGRPFYQRLNQLLVEYMFDDFVELRLLCRDDGPAGAARGIYFRLLLIGYFRQRGIAWRAPDSWRSAISGRRS